MIRQAMKSLLSHKVINLLLIMQLSMVFSSLFAFISSMEKSNIYRVKAGEVMDLNSSIFLQSKQLTSIDEVDANEDNYKSFVDYLNSKEDIEYGTYDFTGFIMNLDYNLSDEQKLILKNKLNRYVGNVSSAIVETLIIDNNFSKLMKFPIEEGRFFQGEDFGKEINESVPIILGHGYKEVFKIGDEFKSVVGDVTYKVIGFLKENFIFFGSGSSMIESMYDFKWASIIPLNKRYEGEAVSWHNRVVKGCIYQIKNDSKAHEIMSDIDKKANTLNINVQSKYLSDLINDAMENHKETVYPILVEGLVFGMFSISTFVIAVLTFITRRKREFGIRIASGASISYIMRLISTEIIIIISIAFVINIGRRTIFGMKLKELLRNEVSVYSPLINGKMVLLFILLLITVFLLIAALPMYKIKKTEPKDLIGGVE